MADDILTQISKGTTDYKEPVFGPELAAPYIDAYKKIVETRRSVRIYDSTPVPDAVVHECLRLTLLAPNSSNLQPWEFIWIKTPELKSKIAAACFGQPAATTAQVLIACVAHTSTWKKNAAQMLERFKKTESKGTRVPKGAWIYYKKLAPLMYQQGPLGIFGVLKKVFFFIAGFFKVVPREPTSSADMRVWATKSTALGCENLMLAFRAHGFDSCPMEGFDSLRVRKLLNLPRDASVTMIVSAGKRGPGGVYGQQVRFDPKQFLREV